MDRKTALHILESLGPEVDPTAWAATADIAAGHEVSEAEAAEQQIAAAAELLAEDPLLASEFALRQQWDRQIARAMVDVPVPAGLKQRLLNSLAEAAESESESAVNAIGGDEAAGATVGAPAGAGGDISAEGPLATPAANVAAAAKPVRSSRRVWLKAGLATSAALLVAAFAWWSAAPRPVPFQLARLQQITVDDLSGRPAFEGRYTPALPAGWEYSDLHLAQAPQSLQVGEATEPVAGYAFQVNSRQLGTIRGVLLVVPVELLDSPVENTSIDGPVSYVTSGETVYTTVAWREGPLAYLCLTAGGDNAMRVVRQAVKGEPA